MDIVSKTLAKFALSMLAKRISKIAFALFVVFAVLYLAWGPLTGNALGADVAIGILAIVMLAAAIAAAVLGRIMAPKIPKII